MVSIALILPQLLAQDVGWRLCLLPMRSRIVSTDGPNINGRSSVLLLTLTHVTFSRVFVIYFFAYFKIWLTNSNL